MKEKIEEIAKVLHDRIIDQTWRPEKVAKELYNIAIPEGSVVLSREEYEKLKKYQADRKRLRTKLVEYKDKVVELKNKIGISYRLMDLVDKLPDDMTDDDIDEAIDNFYNKTYKETANNYRLSMILSIQEMEKYLELSPEQAKLLYHHNNEVAKQFGAGVEENKNV